MSETLAIDDPEALERAVAVLGEGRLVVVPTDTVYAVVADAFSPQATRRLLRVRGSGRNRPLPVLIGRPRQLSGLAIDVPAVADRLAADHWPGPLTLVLRAVPGMSWDLGNTGGTVAVRLPDEAFLQQLIDEVGPLAGSGATRRGRPAATSVEAAREHFGDGVALYVDAGGRDGQRSTIVDASRGEAITVLRQGAVPEEDLHPPAVEAGGGDDADPFEAAGDAETTDDSAAALDADEEDR